MHVTMPNADLIQQRRRIKPCAERAHIMPTRPADDAPGQAYRPYIKPSRPAMQTIFRGGWSGYIAKSHQTGTTSTCVYLTIRRDQHVMNTDGGLVCVCACMWVGVCMGVCVYVCVWVCGMGVWMYKHHRGCLWSVGCRVLNTRGAL